jgi:hypothetical protein
LQDYLLLRRARAAAAPGRHRRARHRRHRRRARHAARRGLAQLGRVAPAPGPAIPAASRHQPKLFARICRFRAASQGLARISSRTGRKWPCNTAISTSRT